MKINTEKILKSRWFLILSIVIIAYFFWSLGKMAWQNYQVNQQISKLEDEVVQIEDDNQKLSDLIAYFQTETFKEQEAREKLGLVLPGEKVLVFPGNDKNTNNDIVGTTTDNSDDKSEPNHKKWWSFFFSNK